MRTAMTMVGVSLALGGLAAGASAHGMGAGMHSGQVAYPGGVAAERGGGFAIRSAAGRSSFRSDRSHFAGAPGSWGFRYRRDNEASDGPRGMDGYKHRGFHTEHPLAWRGHGWRGHEGRWGGWAGRGYWPGYGGYGEGEAFSRGYGEPHGFGPQEPYGDSFANGDDPEPPAAYASALAPSVYGPGPKDGAYAYGYNGYAPTPALALAPGGYGPIAYSTTRSALPYEAGASACGC